MLEDLRANSWSLRPCCMVLAYRVAHFCSVWRKKNVLNNLWAAPLLVLYRIPNNNDSELIKLAESFYNISG